MDNVLIKYVFNPYGESHKSVDYRIVRRDIADILKSYISTDKFKKSLESMHKSFSNQTITIHADIIIIDNCELIDAYTKLKDNDLIQGSDMYRDMIELIIEFLVNDSRDDDESWIPADMITDNDIIIAWSKL